MRKMLSLIIIFVLLFSGCSASNVDEFNEQNEVSVVLPDEETAATVNGYYLPPKNDEIKYYGNTKSKKFHLKDCIWVSKTDKNNLLASKERNRFINDGYIPCKKCKP